MISVVENVIYHTLVVRISDINRYANRLAYHQRAGFLNRKPRILSTFHQVAEIKKTAVGADGHNKTLCLWGRCFGETVEAKHLHITLPLNGNRSQRSAVAVVFDAAPSFTAEND